jgi:hypothetical protein
VNRDLDTLDVEPLKNAHLWDEAEWRLDDSASAPDIGLDDIISHGDFLAALALPTVGAKNLEAVWDDHVSKLSAKLDADQKAAGGTVPPKTETQKDDPAIEIAENRSNLGIATTTLRVLSTDENGETCDVPVHIFRRNDGKTLIVSDEAPQKLQKAFAEAGITHINRNGKDAKAEVERALRTLTVGMKNDAKGFLRNAFGYRNLIDVSPSENPLSLLAANIVDKKVEGSFGKFVLKGQKKPAA